MKFSIICSNLFRSFRSSNFPRRLGPLAVLALAACSPSKAPSSSSPAAHREGPIKITTTIGMIKDIAVNIGAAHVAVTGLMGPGVDPHLYKATQGDLQKLSGADLILYSGLHLEGKMADVLVKMVSRTRTVQVTETIPENQLRQPPEFLGHPDPHVWFNVKMWMMAAERIRDELIAMDPANAAEYGTNAEAYLARLAKLDAYAREQIATIPKESRVLVTAHDAFGYFGQAYDIEVMGLQGISTAAEYGLQDLDRLIGVIVSRKVKAVFVESSVPRKSIDALVRGVEARGGEVRIGGQLYSDAMGADGTPDGTYEGMVRHNVDTIAAALR